MNPMLKHLPLAAVVLACATVGAHAEGADKDMKAMMEKSHQKMMSMQMTGKPDVDFAMMMREHHKSALDMGQWELENGKDPRMKDMARKIIASQKKEIAQFDQFLSKNGHAPSASMGASGDSRGPTK